MLRGGQQAFLTSVSHQLRSVGTLANPFRMQGLVDVAKKDVVVDQDGGLVGFAGPGPGGNLQFQTLPIKGFSRSVIDDTSPALSMPESSDPGAQ